MNRTPAQVHVRRRAIVGDLPRSRAMGYVPNELEIFAFNRYKLSNAARVTAIIAARADPTYAMRCYMAIFYSV